MVAVVFNSVLCPKCVGNDKWQGLCELDALVLFVLILTTLTNFSDHQHSSGIDDHMRDPF